MAGNDDVCKLAYDGHLEILKQKIRNNNELATKFDEVMYLSRGINLIS